MLRYTLPFSEGVMSPLTQKALILGGLALILFLIATLYRYELRLIRPGAARLLLAMRVLVISLVWLLTSLKPFLDHVTTEFLPGKVVLAVDRSDSMTITDAQRTPAEKLRLARALRLARDLADDRRL